MKSHRVPIAPNVPSPEEVAEVGADDRVFPGPIKHTITHPVPHHNPVVKEKPGQYIAGIGDGSPVMHGVEPTHEGHDATEVSRREREATHPAGYQPAPKLVDPVPVYLVDDSGPAGLDSWDGIGVWVTGSQSKILGRDGRRRRIYLRNTSTTATDIVRLGQGNNITPQSGYPLMPGQDVSINTADALFMVMDAGSLSSQIMVGMIVEYGVAGAA